MSGRHSFDNLRKQMDADPERRRRVEEKKRAFDALLDLAELAEMRRERGVTQVELAEALGISQPAVSKIETANTTGKSEILLSTLAEYVEALGGHLEVRATFSSDHESDVTLELAAASE